MFVNYFRDFTHAKFSASNEKVIKKVQIECFDVDKFFNLFQKLLGRMRENFECN